MQIRINKIVENSVVDGPGLRTVVFMQGCNLGCHGCQNRALWPSDGGELYHVEALAQQVAMIANQKTAGQVTITGGEPFSQPRALSHFVRALRTYGVTNIIVYTGFTWEVLTKTEAGLYFSVMATLSNTDILVDGPFLRQLDDPMIQYRGSRNQRPINVAKSISAGRVIVEDWDTLEVTITDDGVAFMPDGVVMFDQIGDAGISPMCGQVRGR